jgi:hypothetical protein
MTIKNKNFHSSLIIRDDKYGIESFCVSECSVSIFILLEIAQIALLRLSLVTRRPRESGDPGNLKTSP